MQKTYRYMLTVLILGSYLLSACAGAAPQNGDSVGSSDTNSNEVVGVNDNTPGVNENANENTNGDDNQGNENSNDDNNTNESSSDGLEFNGVVEAITDTAVTINGVVYNIADFTEFKDLVSVGDQVRIHFSVDADGTFIIREIELSSGDDNSNSNSNYNGDDQSNNNSNGDDHNNSNGNSNDDDDNHDNSNSNSNDDD